MHWRTYERLQIAAEEAESRCWPNWVYKLADAAVKLLPERSTLLLGVSPNLIDDHKAKGLIKEPDVLTEYYLVEVCLLEDLFIRIRGDQEGRLDKCKCNIPALGREAISLNHAFTLISEAYETKRKSHTGNVFDRA